MHLAICRTICIWSFVGPVKPITHCFLNTEASKFTSTKEATLLTLRILHEDDRFGSDCPASAPALYVVRYRRTSRQRLRPKRPEELRKETQTSLISLTISLNVCAHLSILCTVRASYLRSCGAHLQPWRNFHASSARMSDSVLCNLVFAV